MLHFLSCCLGYTGIEIHKKLVSSIAEDTFVEPFPLLSVRMDFIYSCMLCCTLKRQWLKLAAWLQITVASLGDFSHLRRVSCDRRREAGEVEVRPDCLVIRLKQLFSLEASVLQVDTLADSILWSEERPYHFDWDFAGLRNWSFSKPQTSELLVRKPSTKVKFSLLSFLQSQSSVGMLTEILPGTGTLGPEKGLSSEVVLELSTSGMLVQPI